MFGSSYNTFGAVSTPSFGNFAAQSVGDAKSKPFAATGGFGSSSNFVFNASAPQKKDTQAMDALRQVILHNPRLIDWEYLSTLNLTDDECREFRQNLNWKTVSMWIPAERALLLREWIDWDAFLRTHRVDIALISDVLSLDWKTVLQTQRLSEDQQDQYVYKLDSREKWTLHCTYQKMSETFMEKHADDLDWKAVGCFQQLDLKFARRHESRLSMKDVEHFQRSNWSAAPALGAANE